MKTEYFIIAIAIAIVAVAVFVFIERKKVAEWLKSPEAKQLIKDLILDTEAKITGTAKGQERLKEVCGEILKRMPKILQNFVSQDELVEAVNYIFDKMAVKLKDGHTVPVNVPIEE